MVHYNGQRELGARPALCMSHICIEFFPPLKESPPLLRHTIVNASEYIPFNCLLSVVCCLFRVCPDRATINKQQTTKPTALILSLPLFHHRITLNIKSYNQTFPPWTRKPANGTPTTKRPSAASTASTRCATCSGLTSAGFSSWPNSRPTKPSPSRKRGAGNG